MINKTLEQKHIEEAMQDIRDAMADSAVPNADILDLTDKVITHDTLNNNRLLSEDNFNALQDILSNNGMMDAKHKNREAEKDDFEFKPKPISNQGIGFKGESAECNNPHERNRDPKNSFTSCKIENGITNMLEEEVLEALKPHITSWLDKNLSAIVRDMVGKEIKKLASRV